MKIGCEKVFCFKKEPLIYTLEARFIEQLFNR